MEHIETREDEEFLVDLGAVSEETRGEGFEGEEQDDPLRPKI